MKRRNIIILITLFIISAMSISAQRDADGDGIADSRDQCPDVAGSPDNNGCPIFTIVSPEQPARDSDGDGIPDSDDQCPNQAGTRENRGCPELDLAPNPPQPTAPPNNDDGNEQPPVPQPDPNDLTPMPPTFPDPNDPTPLPPTFPDPNDPTPDPDDPFIPPGLPDDGCYVTPNIAGGVNVRNAPMLSGAIIGSLFPNTVYEAKGYVLMGTEIWFMLSNYEGSTGTIGYSSRSVLNASNCEELRAIGTEPSEDSAAFEVEIPDGCWISGIEDGQIIIDCLDAQGTYTVGEPATGEPAYPNRGGVIDKLVFCNPGDIWWIDFREPGPGEGICINTIAEMREVELQPGMTRLVAIVPDDNEPIPASMPFPVWVDIMKQQCHPGGWWAIEGEDGAEHTGDCTASANTLIDDDRQLGLIIEPTNPEPPVPPVQNFIEGSDDSSSADTPSSGNLCGPDQLVFATWLEDEDGNVIEGSADIECVDSDFFD